MIKVGNCSFSYGTTFETLPHQRVNFDTDRQLCSIIRLQNDLKLDDLESLDF